MDIFDGKLGIHCVVSFFVCITDSWWVYRKFHQIFLVHSLGAFPVSGLFYLNEAVGYVHLYLRQNCCTSLSRSAKISFTLSLKCFEQDRDVLQKIEANKHIT